MKVDSTFADRKICILGLGYVGLTLAAVMADVGFEVLGVEIREDVLEGLKSGEPHFHEPGLAKMLRQGMNEGLLKWAKFIPDDCDADVYVISVGTPLGDDGKVRLDMIERVTREIATKARPGALLILRSTVMVGTTNDLVTPVLDEQNKGLQVAFCPERTVEGQALRELRELPQIVGANDLGVLTRAAQIFQFLTSTVVRVSSTSTAEMVKLIDNTQRDVRFAFANEVAKMCDGLGISAQEVIRAGNLGYTRNHTPMPGPVGGPCLSKDPHILAQGLARVGVIPDIASVSRALNEQQLRDVATTIRGWTDRFSGFAEKPVISLLGLAFKGRPATDDLRGTTAEPILNALREAYPGAEFRGYDAVATAEQISQFGVTPADTFEEAFEGANLALILNNHVVFETMALNELALRMRGPAMIYDLWHNFNAQELRLPKDVGYAALGNQGNGKYPPMTA